jgi:hypothetical protein
VALRQVALHQRAEAAEAARLAGGDRALHPVAAVLAGRSRASASRTSREGKWA